MRSDVFEKSTKFMHTDDVFAWSLYGVFPGLLGQFTLVTYPRRTGGKRLTSSLGPRDAKGIGLGTKGPTYDSLRCIYFLARIFSPAGYFFLKSPIPPPPPQSQMVVPEQITLHYPVLIGRDAWEFASSNQNHYPDLGTDTWSVGDFCPCF